MNVFTQLAVFGDSQETVFLVIDVGEESGCCSSHTRTTVAITSDIIAREKKQQRLLAPNIIQFGLAAEEKVLRNGPSNFYDRDMRMSLFYEKMTRCPCPKGKEL